MERFQSIHAYEDTYIEVDMLCGYGDYCEVMDSMAGPNFIPSLVKICKDADEEKLQRVPYVHMIRCVREMNELMNRFLTSLES